MDKVEYLIQGKIDQAQEILFKTREDTLRINNTDVLPDLEAAQAEQWLYLSNVHTAKRWAGSFHSDAMADKVFRFEFPILIQSRILLRHGSRAEVQAVRRRVEQELVDLENHHFTYRAIQSRAHLALVYDRLDLEDEAIRSLRRAVILAQKGGLMRSFIDCGPELAPLLVQLDGPDLDAVYLEQLLRAFDDEKDSNEPNVNTPIDSLTQRELEVLRLLGDGLTNQEIADELVISLNTVKRHTSHIYKKLAVKNRREAVRKSRQLDFKF